MSTAKMVGSGIAAIMLISFAAWFFWNIARHWNYSLGYESMVRDTVCEMVKPEHLLEPCK